MRPDKPFYVYFDVETTGLNPFVHEPFEFGLVIEDHRGKVVDEDAFYFDPNEELADPGAMEVNQFYARRDAGELPRKLPRPEAAKRLYDATKGATMVVNSLQFDLMMAGTVLYNQGVVTNTPELILHPTPWSHRSIDLKSVTAGKLGIDLAQLTTGAIKRHFGIRQVGEHTALGDAWFNHDWYHALELYRG
jgi:DNA polymerase III alpha subunit (gram-positive type)